MPSAGRTGGLSQRTSRRSRAKGPGQCQPPGPHQQPEQSSRELGLGGGHPGGADRVLGDWGQAVPDGQLVGFILLNDVNSANQCVEFQRIVVEPRDQGYGRQAIRLLKRYAFEELGAHRLWLSVKEFNACGRALYLSEGFVEEGMLRECVKGPAAYESALIMAILDREYTPG